MLATDAPAETSTSWRPVTTPDAGARTAVKIAVHCVSAVPAAEFADAIPCEVLDEVAEAEQERTKPTLAPFRTICRLTIPDAGTKCPAFDAVAGMDSYVSTVPSRRTVW